MMNKKTQHLLDSMLPNGKGVWVPIDHGASDFPLDGLHDIENTIRQLIDANVNAIIAQKGVISAYSHLAKETNTHMVAHLSVSTIHGGPDASNKVLVGSVEECIQRGADAVSCQINMGSDGEAAMIRAMGKITSQAYNMNIPVLGMIYARGPHLRYHPEDESKGQAHAIRLAFELGCDVAKTTYHPDPDVFSSMISGAPIPILVAGGERTTNDLGVLQMVEQAIKLGASGVCMGRQIFGHPDPKSMASAIVAIVHNGASATEAYEILKQTE